jgi:hypothetical protein
MDGARPGALGVHTNGGSNVAPALLTPKLLGDMRNRFLYKKPGKLPGCLDAESWRSTRCCIG